MMAKDRRPWAPLMMLAVLSVWGRANGFGVDGHRIAGLVAQERLCARAEAEVRVLGEGRGLDELGLWADWIRDEPEWRHSAPWHYMNIPDGAPLNDYRHPPEGDILWAISHFAEELRDPGAAVEQRRHALGFLVHFVVDLHQPLHVGRESDRGGNTVRVDAGTGEPINLHRFWDTEAVMLSGLDAEDYAHDLSRLADENADAWAQSTALDWARESQALRPDVYDLADGDDRLTRDYLGRAVSVTRLRLAQAGVRLAAELNRVFCPGAPESQ